METTRNESHSGDTSFLSSIGNYPYPWCPSECADWIAKHKSGSPSGGCAIAEDPVDPAGIEVNNAVKNLVW